LDHIRKFNKKTFASLNNRNYRLYFIGQTISFLGTWMQTVALGLLVLKLTGSGTALGVMMGLRFFPVLLIGLLAGIIIDRFPKQQIIFITQALSGVLSLLLGIVVMADIAQMWMIYLFALSMGILTAFDNPGRHTFITEMVGKDLVGNVVSLNATMVHFARIVGPSLAGIAAVTIGLGPCFLINGITYIPVLITLLMINKNELHTAPPSQEKNQLKKGFSYIRSTPVLAVTLVMACIIGTLTFNFSVILPLFAQFTFHNAPAYAFLTAAMSTGAVLGGLFTASKDKASIGALIVTSALFGISMLILSLMPTLITAMIFMLVVGIFSINFTSMATSILQIESAQNMRGRVMSLWTIALLGSTPIGAPIMGWIGEHAGPRWGLAIGGIAAITAAAIGAMMMVKVSSHFAGAPRDKRVLNTKY
jgi:MFS family permease